MQPHVNFGLTKLEAASELLFATKRNLQLVDEHIALLQQGRSAVELASDVSSEHRAMWLGARDDLDHNNGIQLGAANDAASFGFNNPKTGTIRNQEDAAFVCTDILVAIAGGTTALPFSTGFREDEYGPTNQPLGGNCVVNPLLRLTDGNTGRDLIAGTTTGTIIASADGVTQPNVNNDRGAIPFSYISSLRPGLGSNVKNRLFSEFTIPRAGSVKATVYNLGVWSTADSSVVRVCVSLLGYKVYGG